jgi:hypothetical protein
VVPSTWLSVLFFLLLIAPGLVFDLLAERRRAGADESAFREASRVALASTAFSGAALAILATVRALKPGWMPDPRRLLGDGQAYLADEYRLVLRALLIQVAIALVLALITHAILAKTSGASIRQRSAWSSVFHYELPDGSQAHARVRMADESVYIGRVAHFTANVEHADRELVLAPPLYSKVKDGQLKDVPEEWQRIVVRGDQIVVLSVQYRPKDPPQA